MLDVLDKALNNEADPPSTPPLLIKSAVSICHWAYSLNKLESVEAETKRFASFNSHSIIYELCTERPFLPSFRFSRERPFWIADAQTLGKSFQALSARIWLKSHCELSPYRGQESHISQVSVQRDFKSSNAYM